METIKSLTLSTWGPNKEHLPLEIGVRDLREYTAFTIAVLRGHLETAKTILAISIAQFKPNEQRDNTRYRIRAEYSDDEDDSYHSDADSEGIQLESHVIDDEFTFENVGEVKNQVESKIAPLSILTGTCNMALFFDKEQRPETDIRSLTGYAVWKDDVELLKLLISMGEEILSRQKDAQKSSIYNILHSDFVMAMRLGRLRCLEEMIKRTGAGLPLDKLAEESKVEVKETPKYYQGLSVHGKKRADWAAAGRGVPVTRSIQMSPPLLLAAREGNLAAVEWFLGTAPGRHYTEFARAHKKDARLKKLSMSDKGMEQSILDWLDSRRKAPLAHQFGPLTYTN